MLGDKRELIYKKIYAVILRIITVLFGIDAAKKFDIRLRFHRSLNLKNPSTLADKVSYIELHDQSPLASKCTDKYAVRDYIRERGLADILVPTVGGPWNSFEEIDFSILPNRFVLKATHGCKMNYMVPDKQKLNIDKCKSEVKRWLNTTYGTYSMEPHYIHISHRIYAEKYLDDMDKLTDYKFHCLNGVPQFVLTVSDRHVEGDSAMQVILDLFDMEWNPIFEVVGANQERPGNGSLNKPRHFDEMVEISKVLSKDFKFVRVDLYEVDDKVLFGELTFSPACCVFPYFTESFLYDMGDKLII